MLYLCDHSWADHLVYIRREVATMNADHVQGRASRIKVNLPSHFQLKKLFCGAATGQGASQDGTGSHSQRTWDRFSDGRNLNQKKRQTAKRSVRSEPIGT
jgi:hypothetical protein